MFPLAFLLSLVVVAIAREVVRAVRALRERRRLPAPACAVYFVRRRRGRRFVAQVVEPALPPGVRVVKQREIPALPPCTRLPCFAVVDGARVRYVVEVRAELDALRARYNAGHEVDATPIRSIARAVLHAARGQDDPARLRSSSATATAAAVPS